MNTTPKTDPVAAAAPVASWRDRKHFMWFPFSFTVYELKDDRLFIQRGFLKTTYDETLLYRITDIKLTRTLGQKIFGTGTIELCTKVDHDKHILLENIKHPMEVNRLLSDAVEDVRNRKNIVGKEFYGGHGGMMDLDGDGDIDGDDAFM